MIRTVAEYLAQPAVAADQQLSYGPDADQCVDLYLPAGGGPHAVAVLLHGGCWQQQYDRRPLGPLCADLRSAGVAVWNIEYRRLGGAGGWPQTFQDAAQGLDLLRTQADTYHLDANRVITVGHSAGGHLALWLAARRRLPAESPLYSRDPLPLRGVVALAALADLAAGAAVQLCGSACSDLVGGDPARFAWTSPAALLPLGLPQRHLVGAEDAIVPPDYLATFVAAAQAAGDDATLTVLPAAGHFEPTAVDTPAWALARSAIMDLLGVAQ